MIDTDYLKQHYSGLTDEELRDIDPTKLVGEAQLILTAELQRRELVVRPTEAKQPYRLITEKAEWEAPNWSKRLVAYATFSPLLLLPVLGMRGILWIALVSLIGRVVALKYIIKIRSAGASKKGGIVNFVVLHILASVAFVLIAQSIWISVSLWWESKN